jgi:hypothetical protein
MKAVRYYGTEDVRAETVPDPAIQNPRDAINVPDLSEKQNACIKVVMKPGH